jgi:hypothetical protein
MVIGCCGGLEEDDDDDDDDDADAALLLLLSDEKDMILFDNGNQFSRPRPNLSLALSFQRTIGYWL